MLRRVKITRFGCEDVTGAIVVTDAGQLYDVVGMTYNDLRGITMLQVRHFNGESAPDVHVGYVKLVLPDAEPENNPLTS